MVDAFAIVVALFRLPVTSQRAGVVADAFVVTVTTVAIVAIIMLFLPPQLFLLSVKLLFLQSLFVLLP